MAEDMTHKERIQAALQGKEVDRLPVSMWRHFFARETSDKSLAEAMLAFQRRYDWDFMKVNPRASYHVEDWGVRVRYSGGQKPKVLETPVRRPEDWLKLKVLSIDRGVLLEQLQALELIGRGLDGQVPFLITVFTPLSIAGRLMSSEDSFLEHLRQHWDKVSYALDVITETFIAFSKACIERGASGLFYATTAWATAERLNEDEYSSYAKQYDLKLLNALPPAEFHILHVCRDNNLFRSLIDYPVNAFNWDVRGKGNPSLSEGRAMVGGRAVIGGLAHGRALKDATPQEIAGDIQNMQSSLGTSGWMLGTGCTFLPGTPASNIRAVRNAVVKT